MCSNINICELGAFVMVTCWLQIVLEILIIARGSRPVWPVAGRVRVEPFEIFKSLVRVRVEIILSGAGAGQPNLNRGYPPTRKLKKKKKNLEKKKQFS